MKPLALTGLTLFVLGLGIGIYSAVTLTGLPIEASALFDRWISYLTGYGLSVLTMGIGGALVYLGYFSKNKIS